MSDDNKTRIITPASKPNHEKTDATTRMYTGNGEQASPSVSSSGNADNSHTSVITGVEVKSTEGEVVHDLAVGWIVVVDGPGRGCTREIFYGMNSVGRADDERIALNFGDNNISRSAHAFIVFDEKQNDFYIQHGGKSNLIRLNDAPVLSPIQMKAGDIIELGATKLMFVALCGETFNWEDAGN